MTSLSPNYNLILYDSVLDASELFADFRADIAGTSSSNMLLIDSALASLQTQVDAITGAIKVDAIFSSGTLYTAEVSGITAYEDDQQIILSLNQTSNGTVTLNINSLGAKTIYKIDNSGNVRNIDGNELGINKEYFLRYDTGGGYWVIISAIQNIGVMRKNTESLSTTKTLTDYDAPVQYLDPNGSDRDIILPAEGSYNTIFIIYNSADADEDLNVKLDDTTTLVKTLLQGQIGYFVSDGTTWKYLNYVSTNDIDVSGNSWVVDEDTMSSNSATKLPTQQSVKAYVDNTVSGLSHNLMKNYPSLEKADGTAPLWWTSANATLTEEDATGEGLSGQPNERVLKFVTTSTNGYIQQEFVPADERLLRASSSIVSMGVWVYTSTAGTLSLRMVDSAPSTIATDTTTTTGGWVFLKILNQTLGANSLYYRIQHSATSATVYVCNPILNVGSVLTPWRERGLVQRISTTNVVTGVDPAGGSWTSVDFTSATSPNTAMISLMVVYVNSTTVGKTIQVRPYGLSSYPVNAVTESVIGQFFRNAVTILCDDQQRIEYDSDAVAGDTEALYIAVSGIYYEWE